MKFSRETQCVKIQLYNSLFGWHPNGRLAFEDLLWPIFGVICGYFMTKKGTKINFRVYADSLFPIWCSLRWIMRLLSSSNAFKITSAKFDNQSTLRLNKHNYSFIKWINIKRKCRHHNNNYLGSVRWKEGQPIEKR